MHDDIELVREKVDIVDFVRQYTPLTQTGKNFKGLCPFHTEKTPSFFVRPDKGMYYCFGCQRGGDVFHFTMEKENVTFGEALELLAKRAGVVLTQSRDPQRGQKKERILHVLGSATEYFCTQLNTAEGVRAFKYIQQRGLTEQTITAFQLGYAPDSWDTTLNYLLKRGYTKDEIIDAGLALPSSKSKTGAYDRFRNRVMFPIIDHLGRIVGFSGRSLESTEQAKYINSPETIVFSKGSVLYGYDKAHQVARDKDYMILVEGNLDVISLHQAGIANVVAPLGTGFTSQQLKLLERVSSRLMIVFDSDTAGLVAAERAAIEAAANGFEIKVVTLQNAKDPDEAVRGDVKQFTNDLATAQPALEFFLLRARKTYPGQSSFDHKKVAEYIFSFIKAFSDNSIKEQALELLSRELSFSLASLKQDFDLWQKETHSPQKEAENSAIVAKQRDPLTRQERLEEYLLSILLNVSESVLKNENVRSRVLAAPDQIYLQQNYRELFTKIKKHLENGGFSLTDEVQSVPEEMQEYTKKLLLKDFGELLDSDESAMQELTRTITHLEEAYYKREIRDLTKGKEKLDEQTEQVTQINEKIRLLTQRLREINH